MKKISYDVFWILGISYIGAGVVFISVDSTGVGVALLGLGVVWVIIGLSKRKK